MNFCKMSDDEARHAARMGRDDMRRELLRDTATGLVDGIVDGPSMMVEKLLRCASTATLAALVDDVLRVEPDWLVSLALGGCDDE